MAYGFNSDKSKVEIETGGTVLCSTSDYLSNQGSQTAKYVSPMIAPTLSEAMSNYSQIEILTYAGDEDETPVSPGKKCGSFSFSPDAVTAIKSKFSQSPAVYIEDETVKTRIVLNMSSTSLSVEVEVEAGAIWNFFIVVIGYGKKS
jgi:hypothetical protein